jgi:hypothetical protein
MPLSDFNILRIAILASTSVVILRSLAAINFRSAMLILVGDVVAYAGCSVVPDIVALSIGSPDAGCINILIALNELLKYALNFASLSASTFGAAETAGAVKAGGT